MVVAAGCLIVLLVALPFVIGRLALDVERTLRAGAGHGRRPRRRRRAGDQPAAHADRLAHDRGARRRPAAAPRHPAARSRPRSTEAVYTLPTARRGVVTVGPALIVKSDLLDLMRREIVQTGTQTLWVHPRVAALRPLPVGFAKDLEGPTSDASPAGDVAFHALREYELGDDHRHIHWMSTARTGTLMVRHYVDNRRPQPHRRRRHRDRLVPVRARVRRRHRDRRLARRVVDAAAASRSPSGSTGEVVMGQNRPAGAQRPARPPDAGRRRRRHRRRRRRAARPAGRGRHVGARRDHRQRADRPLPARWPPSPAARPASCSCACGRQGDRLPGVAARRQGRRRRQPRPASTPPGPA